jgi:threonine synthase
MTERLLEPMLVNTGDNSHPVPVSQAILEGYAPDNELYTFSDYPQISALELSELSGKSYADIFYMVTKKLLGSAMPDHVLRSTADTAYSDQNFDFDEDDHNLRFTTLPSGLHIVGLSDGPTGAFKDMAMQPFARWMSHLQAQTGNPLTILLSTSGDTGPAALNAFGGLTNTEIINMLPEAGVSAFQWSQMAELADTDGIHVLEVGGDFSYINDLHMVADLAYDLGSVNSVNIARIIAQIPYYAASYIKAVEREGLQIGDPIDVSVPSGNFGNALSAITARKMGVPIRNIVIATNENNTLDRLMSTGVFKLSEFQHTDSSAQDVRMPSNVWRYFAMAFNNDSEKISRVYHNLKEFGSVAMSEIGVEDTHLNDGILSFTVSAVQRRQAIQQVYAASNGKMIRTPLMVCLLLTN